MCGGGGASGGGGQPEAGGDRLPRHLRTPHPAGKYMYHSTPSEYVVMALPGLPDCTCVLPTASGTLLDKVWSDVLACLADMGM